MTKKKLDTKEVIGQTVEKLNEKMLFLKKELFNLRFQKTMGELKNTSRFAVIRKEVARIKTELVKRLKSGGK
jgi:large subunit ribosomal protein L29